MDVIRLFIDLGHSSDPAVTRELSGSTPELVVQQRQIMLETVVRLYYARHSFQLNDPWVVYATSVLGNLAVAKLMDKAGDDAYDSHASRSILILSAQGMRMQSKNFHVGRLINQMLEDAMTPQDLQLVQTYCKAERVAVSDQEMIQESTQSLWPVPGVSKVSDDPVQTRLETFMEKTQEAEQL